MDERLRKYYSLRAPDEDCDRGSAISAFGALLRGDIRGGKLFLMVSDDLMERHLEQEDYEYWLEKKSVATI